MRLWFGKGAWASHAARQRINDIAPDQVGSIAIIRHAALGDMLLTRPFILECRRHFPNAKITLSLVSNYTRGAPEDIVDRIHVIPGTDQRDVSRSTQIRKMKELGYHDLIFDAAATSRSFWVCKLNRAMLKVGYPYRQLQRRLFYDVAILRSAMRYETDAMLDMLHAFGFKSEYPLRFNLPGEVLKRERPYIVYFTSASMPEKCWPNNRFATLIGLAGKELPEYDHLVLKGVGSSESIDSIMSTLKNENAFAYEAQTVDATTALIKGARAVVSNDTGIRHLAVAAEVPTVGIFLQAERHHAEPYRYWLRYPIHEVAMRADGMAPDVEEVFPLLQKVLQARKAG
ncbi:MAG: lipopolysaccharide heptosyltransferase family protein [Gammaproteobacteria bacterium]|nr:lipopolysaccharide heptosyltransferase family protein [Gammaproteobacteria bacterium]